MSQSKLQQRQRSVSDKVPRIYNYSGRRSRTCRGWGQLAIARPNFQNLGKIIIFLNREIYLGNIWAKP